MQCLNLMNIINRSYILIIGSILFISQVMLNHWVRGKETVWVDPPDGFVKSDPQVYRLMSFGHLPLVIDWLFIKCLTDTQMNKVTEGAHSSLFYTLDLIAELDPLYFEIYLIAGNLLTVIQNDGLGARDILLHGNSFLKEDLSSYSDEFKKEYWSNPWRVPLLLGYTYLFHLDDMHHASEVYQEAAEIAGSPSYLNHFQNRLKRSGGEYEVGLKLLKFMIENSQNQVARTNLEKKRQDLFIAQYLFELNQAFLGFLKAQSSYNLSGSISKNQMGSYFREFLRRGQMPPTDPWGGVLDLGPLGKVTSTTPHQAVFGLR